MSNGVSPWKCLRSRVKRSKDAKALEMRRCGSAPLHANVQSTVLRFPGVPWSGQPWSLSWSGRATDEGCSGQRHLLHPISWPCLPAKRAVHLFKPSVPHQCAFARCCAFAQAGHHEAEHGCDLCAGKTPYEAASVRRQDTMRLNTGVIFLRSTNWTLALMDKVYKDSPASSHWGDPFHDQVSSLLHPPIS